MMLFLKYFESYSEVCFPAKRMPQNTCLKSVCINRPTTDSRGCKKEHVVCMRENRDTALYGHVDICILDALSI